METHSLMNQDNPRESQCDILKVDNKFELKKKLIMMESAMPAILAWNMFQMCQSEGISPAAAARKIFQMDMIDGRDYEEPTNENYYEIIQKIDDLILYHRKLRNELIKIEELSKYRDRQMRKRIIDIEMKLMKKRKIFDELILNLNTNYIDLKNHSDLESIHSSDLILFEEMQRLAENELILRKKIDELEKKERIYLQTLEQADELWTALKTRSG